MGTQCASKYGSAVAFLALALIFTLTAEAKQPKSGPPARTGGGPVAPATSGAPNDGKVDISDLENKYWAPKDTDFSVVQNRTFSKDNKFLLAPFWGRVMNDPYSEGNITGLTANYFWSERMGVQVQYMKASLEDNNATKDIGTLGGPGAVPDHGKVTGYYGVGYTIVPFYAKMSFWGSRIIYFDMAFTPHLGMTTYDQQRESGDKSKSALTYGIDISQMFFINKWFAIRADLRNQWRKEEVVKFRTVGTALEGTKLREPTQHDTMFMIGATFYFGKGR